MPIIFDDDKLHGKIRTDDVNPEAFRQEQQDKPEVSFGQAVKDAFVLENPIVSTVKFGLKDKEITDPSFDPFNEIKGTKYEDQARLFINADSTEEVARIRTRIDTEDEAKKNISNAGWKGFVGMIGAGVVDPTILIPSTAGLKVIKGFKAGAKALKIAKGAATGSALTGTAIGIQESVLQQTQLTRTNRESIQNVMFGSLLGGILGGGIGALSKFGQKGAVDALKTVDKGEAPKVSLDPEDIGKGRSAGAAEAVSKEEEGIAFSTRKTYDELSTLRQVQHSVEKGTPEYTAAKKAADKLEKQIKTKQKIGEKTFRILSSPLDMFKSPKIRGLTSEFQTMRSITNQFFEHEFVTVKGLKGFSDVPLETKIKQSHAEVTALKRELDELYINHAGFKMKPGMAQSATARAKAAFDKTVMSRGDFNKRIAKALRNGDKDPNFPEVTKAAKTIRTRMEKVVKEMQELEILPEKLDLMGAMTYFPRRYNIAKVINDRARFHGILKAKFMKGSKLHKALDDMAADEKATSVIDKILGQSDSNLHFSSIVDDFTSGSSGKLTKARVLDIEDSEIEDFLVNDVDEVIPGYLMKARSLIAFKRFLQDNGYESANDVRAAMKADLDSEILKFPKKAQKLNKQFDKEIKLFNEMVGIVTGSLKQTNGRPVANGLKVLRQYQAVAKLGGVLITSLTEMMMAPFKHGFVRTFRDGYLPFIRDFKKAKLEGDQLKDFGLALEMEENGILRAMADGDFSWGIAANKLQGFSENVSQFFGRVSGLSGWTALGKRIAGQVSAARTLRALSSKKISDVEIRRLSSIGIDQGMYSRIKKQFDTYGETSGGSRVSNFEHWADREAAEVFAGSIVREADATIVTPGRGDIPTVIQRSDIAKTIFQFKSFSAAATNKVLLNGLQRLSLGELNAVMGYIYLGAMGYTVYAIKQKIRGKDFKTDPATMAMEGVTRSGMLGLFGDYMMALNPMAKSSRFAAMSTVDSMLGPSFGSAKNVYLGATALKDGKITDAESKKMIQLLPFQNLFYLRLLLDKAEGKKR